MQERSSLRVRRTRPFRLAPIARMFSQFLDKSFNSLMIIVFTCISNLFQEFLVEVVLACHKDFGSFFFFLETLESNVHDMLFDMLFRK